MGHGIAQVAAQMAGFNVVLVDIKQKSLDRAMAMIKDSLQNFHKKGLLIEDRVKEILNRIHPALTSDLDRIIPK